MLEALQQTVSAGVWKGLVVSAAGFAHCGGLYRGLGSTLEKLVGTVGVGRAVGIGFYVGPWGI